ncbi:hypothetical protein [Paraliobacillus salinarum]|uniref:hypothetical protein n=1 Tax=Paraliobacillus salinarum TaxID=1158996 RepID=UPI0015F51C15|nr:hypothetical protein [Paraliobacillus salinarum]
MSYNNDAIDKVRVNFQGYDSERSINVNGNIPLTAEQYKGNESLTALEGIVRQEVSTKILDDGTAV